MRPPKRYSQYANMFIRGKATSGAPICSGTSTFANPAKSGVAKSSSMIVPCIVKNWLYCSLLCRTCIPGSKSSARITRAIKPPMQKKMNDEIRYMYPIVLWSVDVIHFTTVRPKFCRDGSGPGMVGVVVVAISPSPPRRSFPGRVPRRVRRSDPVP